MTIRLGLLLACTLLSLTACIIEPYGGGGRGDYSDRRLGYDRDGGGPSDYGHRVWHE